MNTTLKLSLLGTLDECTGDQKISVASQHGSVVLMVAVDRENLGSSKLFAIGYDGGEQIVGIPADIDAKDLIPFHGNYATRNVFTVNYADGNVEAALLEPLTQKLADCIERPAVDDVHVDANYAAQGNVIGCALRIDDRQFFTTAGLDDESFSKVDWFDNGETLEVRAIAGDGSLKICTDAFSGIEWRNMVGPFRDVVTCEQDGAMVALAMYVDGKVIDTETSDFVPTGLENFVPSAFVLNTQDASLNIQGEDGRIAKLEGFNEGDPTFVEMGRLTGYQPGMQLFTGAATSGFVAAQVDTTGERPQVRSWPVTVESSASPAI